MEDDEVEEENEIIPIEEIMEIIDGIYTQAGRNILDQSNLLIDDKFIEPLKTDKYIHCNKLGIDIPMGGLFHPCCRSDVETTVNYFKGGIQKTLHFAFFFIKILTLSAKT